jgi:hypothetical protein
VPLAGIVSALAVLAAVVPICGSLYAGASFLAQQAELAHEMRVRRRIRPLVQKRHDDALSRMQGVSPSDPAWKRIQQQPYDFERRLLEYNGIRHSRPTLGDFDLATTMSGPVVPPEELKRQWVLLLTAAAGLVLLALDLLMG